MFSYIDKIIEYNNKYYILDKSSLRTVVSFKKDGTPDTKYGRIGQGPGEYMCWIQIQKKLSITMNPGIL